MDRVEAIYRLTKFQSIATLAGITDVVDSTPGFEHAIDSALRKLGFTQSELADADVEDADIEGYLALLDYFALKYLKINLAPLVDIAYTAGEGKVDKKRSQTFALVNQLLEDAREEVEALGYLASDFELVSFNTDYLEPASTEI